MLVGIHYVTYLYFGIVCVCVYAVGHLLCSIYCCYRVTMKFADDDDDDGVIILLFMYAPCSVAYHNSV